MNPVDVTCAVIIFDNKYLVTRRSETMARAGKWEFPGGKIEAGETPEQCIKREIREELNIGIKVLQWLEPVIHSYPDITIRLIPCIAVITSGSVKLNEHSNFKWMKKDELKHLNWSDADVSVVDQIMKLT